MNPTEQSGTPIAIKVSNFLLLTLIKLKLKFMVWLIIALVLSVITNVVIFSYFSVYRYKKNLEIYLFLKRARFRGDSKDEVLSHLVIYYGFDIAGALNLIEKAVADDYEYFRNLKL